MVSLSPSQAIDCLAKNTSYSVPASVYRVSRLNLAFGLLVVLGVGGLTGRVGHAASPLDAVEEALDGDAGSRVADSVTFEKQVRPILKAHCFLCHGEEPEKAGELDLRLVRLMRDGGESGTAVVAGELDESLLWQKVASEEMPPGPKKLSPAERDIISTWITQGARTARDEPLDPNDARFTEEELEHWAFLPVVRPSIPSVPEEWAQLAPIDRFVFEKLRENELTFAPEADRRTWLRRVSFDLTGLPPTPGELREFLADSSPEAWQKVVDRLLQSPQYGVRWARHWLDLAGYAESEGQIEKDRPRPHAWRYRDYVVNALNQDLPYDRFVIEQLAGDLLIDAPVDPNNERHANLLAATGFLRQVKDITQTEDNLANRNQTVADTIEVVSSAFLGLTVACAQCHDHRYDPIAIEDYYRLRAVFDPVMPIRQWKKPAERLIDMTDEATRAARAAIEAEAVAVQQDINERRRAHCQTIQDREIQAAPEAVREELRQAVNTPAKEQSNAQKALLERYPKVRTIDWIVGQLVEYDNAAHRAFQEEEKQVAAIRERKPLDRMLMAVSESASPRESHVFFRGDPESPQQRVEPGELTVLLVHRDRAPGLLAAGPSEPCCETSAETAADESGSSGEAIEGSRGGDDQSFSIRNRLDYARSLTDGSHPLVARVLVNRVWLQYFGAGLVRTPGDFGLNGQPPSHPELLDWLADDFVRHGWSLKRLHRQIALSRTYRQASGLTWLETTKGDGAPAEEVVAASRAAWLDSRQRDPENRWLSRMTLRRLDAEAIRDAILAMSDQLDQQLAGPSVPVSEDDEGKAVIGSRILRDGLFAGTRGVGPEAARRSLYLSAHRSLRLNLLQTFDLPEMSPNCQQRGSSTVTPQALLLMNDSWVIQAAENLSQRLWQETDAPERRIGQAFELTFARLPTPQEVADSLVFWDRQSELFRQDPDKAWRERLEQDPEVASRRGLASLCQMLLASNRFLYLE